MRKMQNLVYNTGGSQTREEEWTITKVALKQICSHLEIKKVKHTRENTLDPYLTIHTRKNSKRIKDWSMKTDSNSRNNNVKDWYVWLYKNVCRGTSLVVQWLRLHAPNAGGPGSIPGQETRSWMQQLKIPHAATKILHAETKTRCSQINK